MATDQTNEELNNPVIVDFPLRGEWSAPNTPGKKIPSHGTDILGQRFAYDFLKLKNEKPFSKSLFHYFLFGVPTKSSYCWKESVFAPLDGQVIRAIDGIKEPKRLYLPIDLIKVILNGLFFDPAKSDLDKLLGNHIIMQHDKTLFSMFAHLHPHTIAVKVGNTVKTGDKLGCVGHTGNSTSPHLHFQLMDSPDLLTAKGIACAFKQYEVFSDGHWQSTSNSIPDGVKSINYQIS